jgi:hypothetical protein
VYIYIYMLPSYGERNIISVISIENLETEGSLWKKVEREGCSQCRVEGHDMLYSPDCYIYIYIYVCVCVCVCVYMETRG